VATSNQNQAVYVFRSVAHNNGGMRAHTLQANEPAAPPAAEVHNATVKVAAAQHQQAGQRLQCGTCLRPKMEKQIEQNVKQTIKQTMTQNMK
jgi:hypothetical protein